MIPPSAGRTLRVLVGGTFLVTACAVFALAWSEPRQVPGYVVRILVSAMLASAATGWWLWRRAVAADIDRLQARLDEASTRIESISGSQGRFVGNIAHEIKTPLAIAVSQADLLLTCSQDPAMVRRYAKSIAEDMRHLSDLVESFLRLARPFSHEDTSHHVAVPIHDVVVEAVRRSQSLARECAVSLVPILAESSNGDAAVEVLGDSVLLEAMVENLVRNAVRFSPRGGRVELRVEIQGEMIVLYVRDHGTGIAADHLESVFDWFFQIPPQSARSQGTGFGLAIAKRVAEHHRGTISLRNVKEGGCEFEIRLPRCRAEGPQDARAEGPQDARAEGPQDARAEGPQDARPEGPRGSRANGPLQDSRSRGPAQASRGASQPRGQRA